MDMNKDMLASEISQKTGQTEYAVKQALDALVSVVKAAATRGDKVALRGFGVFTAKESQARTGRNPSTGEAVHIAASTTLKFKAYGKL
jgi:DNA-binding protein HU-beta